MKILFDPDPNAAAGGGGASPEPWINTLPQEMRAVPSLATIPDVPTLAKNYVELIKMRGVPMDRVLTVPEKLDDAEGWGRIHARLGRPETPDKYQMPDVKIEGVAIDDATKKNAFEQFHKLGLSSNQVSGVMEYYLNNAGAQIKAQSEAAAASRAAGEETLKKDWGQKYDLNVQLASRVASKFASNEFLEKYGNDPTIIGIFAKIGQGMLEDTASGKGANSILPDEAVARQDIEKLKGDSEFMKRYFSGDKAARALWDEKHRLAFKDKVA